MLITRIQYFVVALFYDRIVRKVKRAIKNGKETRSANVVTWAFQGSPSCRRLLFLEEDEESSPLQSVEFPGSQFNAHVRLIALLRCHSSYELL